MYFASLSALEFSFSKTSFFSNCLHAFNLIIDIKLFKCDIGKPCVEINDKFNYCPEDITYVERNS